MSRDNDRQTADEQIKDILDTYGEPLAGNVWRVQGTAVIYHKTLERIAARADIVFAPPHIVRAERDEAVILVTGEMKAPNDTVRREWSIGEALVGVNYRVSGKQAAYVFALAEKRAKDRVILKLIGLHGLMYSEDEADEFGDSAREQRRTAAKQEDCRQDTAPAHEDDPAAYQVVLMQRIDSIKTVNGVTDLMLEPDTQTKLAAMAPGIRDMVREHAKVRLRKLGWPARPNQEAMQ